MVTLRRRGLLNNIQSRATQGLISLRRRLQICSLEVRRAQKNNKLARQTILIPESWRNLQEDERSIYFTIAERK